MKKLIFVFLILLVNTDLTAQNLDAFFMSQQTVGGSNTIIGYKYDYELIEGSPYAVDEWVSGSFLTRNGTIFTDVDMKFEAVSGLLAIRHKADSVYLKPVEVPEFQYNIDGEAHFFKNGYEASSVRLNSNTYLMVLYEGEWSIYKEVKKVFKEANFDPVFNTGNRYDSIQDASRYLVKSPDGVWSVINPGRRSLNRLFGSNGREVTTHANRNNLDYDNDAHLGLIFEFASGLK